LLRVVDGEPDAYPKANIPTVELPAAEPSADAAVAAVAELFTHPEYVYLSRVVDRAVVYPKANIPTVELPAADPAKDAALAAVADALTQPE
jgi:sorbitol-specific phosphotransferase system component IIBC